MTVAAIPALANALLPLAVRKFRASRSGVLVRLLSRTAHEIANLVSNQQADLESSLAP